MESTEDQSTASETELPPLTAHEERTYNSLATKMEYFHTGIQAEYEECYKLADGTFNKRGMSLSQYLRFVDQFRMHLTMHHDIEEAHVFPKLAQRMPEFRANERHKNSHKLIHDGLDKIEEAVKRFREDNSSYNPVEMREVFDSFREPLYRHLAEEVRDLSAQNMRKYWSISEVRRLGF